MKKLCLFLLLCSPFFMQAQESDYTMFMTLYLDPSVGEGQAFAMNMATHNQKFHKEGPFQAGCWAVLNGPRSGQVVWAMGPVTWTDIGNREMKAGHDEDWENNVVAKTKDGITEMEYWVLDEDNVYMPEDFVSTTMQVRIIDIVPGMAGRLTETVCQPLIEVYKANNMKRGLQLWSNTVRANNGRDLAWITWYDGWADRDNHRNFSEIYEKTHGEGSWATFLENWRSCINGVDSELRELIPEMGAQ